MTITEIAKKWHVSEVVAAGILADARSLRIAELERALQAIADAHRFNVAALSVTEVHAVCFKALNKE